MAKIRSENLRNTSLEAFYLISCSPVLYELFWILTLGNLIVFETLILVHIL
jgi:hypothetical protein